MNLNSNIFRDKEDLSAVINGIIRVAVNDSEVVTFSHFIDAYHKFHEEVESL